MLANIQERLQALLLGVPNLPHESVPAGGSSEDNVEVRRWGTPRSFDFAVKDHVDVGAPLGLDFETGGQARRRALLAHARPGRAPASRARAVHARRAHAGARLHRGYTPYMVNAATLMGTGQLPKFEQDLFAVRKGGQEATLAKRST